MNKILKFFVYVSAAFSLVSCDDDLLVNDTPADNFDMLWKIIDEKYCFFEFKKDSIKNWDDVYSEYRPMIKKHMSDRDLFDVLASMLNELKDGHVNLISPFNVSRYDIQGDYEFNFDANLLMGDRYLGKDYMRAGGLTYKLLSKDVGYIYYGSFSSSFSNENLDYVLDFFKNTKGIIIDIRGNGGGSVTNVEMIASRFVDKKTLVGYWQNKTGKGHADLSKPKPLYISPSKECVNYRKKVAVLTNRGCYSAANDFTQTMKGLPNVLIFGDKTGGGAGVPVSSELPNGWSFRFSTSPYMDKNKNYTEFGIEPDVKVSMSKEDIDNGVDSIIEKAVEWIVE